MAQRTETLLLKLIADLPSNSIKNVEKFANILTKPTSSISEMEEKLKQLKQLVKELPEASSGQFNKIVKELSAVKGIDFNEARDEFLQLKNTAERELGKVEASVKKLRTESTRPFVKEADLRRLADSFGDIEKAIAKTPASVNEAKDRLKVLTKTLGDIPDEASKEFAELAFIVGETFDNGDFDKGAQRITALQKQIQAEVIDTNDRLKEFRTSLKRPYDISEDSLNGMRKNLIDLRREFDNLDKAQRDGAFGQDLLQKIKAVDEEVKQLEASTGRNQSSVGDYQRSVTAALNEYRTLPEIRNDIKALTSEQQTLAQKAQILAKNLKSGGDQAERLAEELKTQGRTGKDAAEILQKELVETTKLLAKNRAEVANNSKQLKDLQQQASKFGSIAGNAFKAGIAALAAKVTFDAIKQAVGTTIKTFSDFEQSAANLASILGKPLAQIQELRKDAERLGSATRFTATQVVELQTAFSKLGFSETEILGATESTLALAQATGESLQSAAEVAGATLRGFQIDAGDTGVVTDIMAKSFVSSALNLEKFRESMKLVAPIANAASFSLSETTSILSALADRGLDSSIAGTAVKNVLGQIAKEGSGLSKFLGTTVDNFDDMVTALENASKRSNNFALANEHLDERMKASVLALVGSTDQLKRLRQEYDNSAGSAKRAAEIQDATLEGSYKRLQSAIEGLQIAIANRFNTSMQSALNLTASLTSTLREWIAVPLSEELEKEQTELNVLAQELVRTNEGSEDRKRIIAELTEKYPAFISQIDKEKDLEGELRRALQVTNQEYVNRIILQKQREQLEEKLNKVAVAQLQQESKRRDLREALTEANKLAGNSVNLLTGSLEDNIKAVKEALAETESGANRFTSISGSVIGQNEQGKALVRINDIYEQYQNRVKAASKAMEEANVETGNLNTSIVQYGENTGQATDKIEALKAKIEELKNSSPETPKQIAETESKLISFQKELDDLLKTQTPKATPLDPVAAKIKELRQEITDLNAQKLEVVSDSDKNRIQSEIEELQKQLRNLQGTANKSVTPDKEAEKAVEGSMRFFKEAYSKLQQDIANEPDLQKQLQLVEDAESLKKKIDEAERLIKILGNSIDQERLGDKLFQKEAIEEEINALQARLKELGSVNREEITSQIEALKSQIQELTTTASTEGEIIDTPELIAANKELERLQSTLAGIDPTEEIITSASLEAAKEILSGINSEIDQLQGKQSQIAALGQQLATATEEQSAAIKKQIFDLAGDSFKLKLSAEFEDIDGSELDKIVQQIIEGENTLLQQVGTEAYYQKQEVLLKERETQILQSLSDITTASETSTAERITLQSQLTQNALEQERLKLQAAIQTAEEGSTAQAEAQRSYLQFELDRLREQEALKAQIATEGNTQAYEQQKNDLLQQLADIEGIDQAAADKRKAIQKQITALEQEENQKRLQATLDKTNTDIAAIEQVLAATELSNEQRLQLEAELSGLQTNRLQQTANITQAELEIQKAAYDQEVEAFNAKEQRKQELQQAGLELLDNAANALTQIGANKLNQELKAEEQRLEASYKKQLAAAGDNEEQKAKIEEQYQAQKEALEKRAAEKRKENALKEANIQAALAIIKTIANLGFPAAIVGIASTVAATVLQKAVINSTEFGGGGSPDDLFGKALYYASGGTIGSKTLPDGLVVNTSNGNIPDKGRITGPSHNTKSGGVHALHKGVIPITVEGDEGTTRIGKKRWIFNRGVMKNPSLKAAAMSTHSPYHYDPYKDQLAQAVNSIGLMQFGNGGYFGTVKPFTYSVRPEVFKYSYATGGELNEVNVNTSDASLPIQQALLEEMRLLRFEQSQQMDELRNTFEERLAGIEGGNATAEDRARAL